MGTDPVYRVFVSHATADKWIARTICEKIDAIPGAQTFRDDRDIAGGEKIPEVLRDEIVRADEVLVVLTPTSVTRPWVILEVGMAYGHRKRIVPVCYNATFEQIPILAMDRGFQLDDLNSYLTDLRARVSGSRS